MEKPHIFMCQFEQDFILKFLIVTMDKFPPAFASWDAEQRDHHPPGGTMQVVQQHLQPRQDKEEGWKSSARPDNVRLLTSESLRYCRKDFSAGIDTGVLSVAE